MKVKPVRKYLPGSVYPQLPMPGYTDAVTEEIPEAAAVSITVTYLKQDKNSTTETAKSEQELTNKISRSVQKLLCTASDRELEMLNEALAERENEKSSLDDGEEPLWVLELANLKLLYQKREELLEGSLTSTEVAELLDWKHRKTVLDRLKAKDLIGVKDKGIYKFPIWHNY